MLWRASQILPTPSADKLGTSRFATAPFPRAGRRIVPVVAEGILDFVDWVRARVSTAPSTSTVSTSPGDRSLRSGSDFHLLPVDVAGDREARPAIWMLCVGPVHGFKKVALRGRQLDGQFVQLTLLVLQVGGDRCLRGRPARPSRLRFASVFCCRARMIAVMISSLSARPFARTRSSSTGGWRRRCPFERGSSLLPARVASTR